MTLSDNFDADRDMAFVPAALVAVGMVGPGGMSVLSITPEEGTRIAVDMGTMVCHLDTAGEHTLGFPVRPIRPELTGDPTVAWLPADRDEFYAEIEAAGRARGWSSAN
jgi:hypothetical protein